MKFPYPMLLDFVNTKLNAYEIGDLLTMAGFELEGIENVEGDPVLDIKVVSNRGDGLSVFGLAREVLAKDPESGPTAHFERSAKRFADADAGSTSLPENVAQIDSLGCNRFACRGFEDIQGDAQAPEWIQKRLRQAGMRPISLLVDLTNYVMLELGQPLHAFDRQKLRGRRIVVRHAGIGEKLTTLDGQEHDLAGQMMICDAERPVGVPGVMGGLETEVTDATTQALLESANFVNTTVRKTRKQLGLATEASYRFERSVDPELVLAGIRRFTELLAGQIPSVVYTTIHDLYPNPPIGGVISLRVGRASKLLGMTISTDQARIYLQRLGFSVNDGHEPHVLDVLNPSWRPDILREEDLVEELGRVHGYERIPEWLPNGTTNPGGSQGKYYATDRLRNAALQAGFSQMISHSLRDYHPLDRGSDGRIGPRVVASPEHAILRDSLLPSLTDAALRNGGKNLHLFEIGRVFSENSGAYTERTTLALLSTGELLPSDRKGHVSRIADFYSLKGAIDAITGSINVKLTFLPSDKDGRFHPTRQAAVLAGDTLVGVLGQIHPDVADAVRLPSETVLAEFDTDLALFNGQRDVVIRPLSRYPSVRRDIALLIDKSVPFEQISNTVEEACGEVLERQWLFDVFEGAGIPEGKHSLGIGIQLRKAAGNFTDEEANQVRDAAVAALGMFGATTR